MERRTSFLPKVMSEMASFEQMVGKLHSGWSWSNSTVTRLLHEMTSLLWLRCCFTRIKWLQNRHYCLGVLMMMRPVQLTRTYHSYSWQQMLDINRTSSSPARCFNSFGQFGDWERLSFPEVEMFIRCNGRKVFSISWGIYFQQVSVWRGGSGSKPISFRETQTSSSTVITNSTNANCLWK